MRLAHLTPDEVHRHPALGMTKDCVAPVQPLSPKDPLRRASGFSHPAEPDPEDRAEPEASDDPPRPLRDRKGAGHPRLPHVAPGLGRDSRRPVT
jgi:hypothetical protein